jgi:predicted HTH transcriptional regulator
MIAKPLEQININDLQSLIDNSVIEIKTLEYKQELPSKKDKDKKEFLYDVSSFANSNNGDLIYGIQETDGIPTEIVGLTIDNVDNEIARLDTMIRDGIKPRIPFVRIHHIVLENSKIVIIIRIHKS